MAEATKGCPLHTTAYPAAWRIEVVDDDAHRGFEYVRSGHEVARPTGTAR